MLKKNPIFIDFHKGLIGSIDTEHTLENEKDKVLIKFVPFSSFKVRENWTSVSSKNIRRFHNPNKHMKGAEDFVVVIHDNMHMYDVLFGDKDQMIAQMLEKDKKIQELMIKISVLEGEKSNMMKGFKQQMAEEKEARGINVNNEQSTRGLVGQLYPQRPQYDPFNEDA